MSTTPPIPTINTYDDITPGPFSEHELRIRWNEQADEFNQWESLDLSEQLAWAQSCAIAADRKIHPVVDPVSVSEHLPDPEGLPPGYIDAEHTGHDREMLEIFYKACRSEGGTTDEINLRGLKAVLARFARPAVESVTDPEGPTVMEIIDLADEIDEECLGQVDLVRRALARWGRPAIKPVPVSERPWEREGWCNEDGKCWFLYELSGDPTWTLEDPSSVITFGRTYSLPYWSLPMPSNQGEHHGQSQSFNC